MNFPPLPSIPPASQLSRYPSSPPDFMSPITRYEADERARDIVYEIYEETPIDERVYLLTRALQLFPFSVDAFLNWGYIYLHMVTPRKSQEAKEAYQKAVTCAKLLWPELEHQDTIEWGHIEHRPYLRAVSGLAHAQQDLGDLDEAIKGFRYLLRVNPSDNQGVRHDMFFALLESGDYTLAEQFFQTQKAAEADLCWGNVLIVFRKFRRDVAEEEEVQKALVWAIMTNNHVPDMLLNLQALPNRPSSISPGSKDEANNVVNRVGKAWKATPGIEDWFRSQERLQGSKPNDDGTTLFEMLQEGPVVVNTHDGGRMDLTTNVSKIPGRGLPEFFLAPGMKNHDPNNIVAFDNGRAFDHGSSWQDRYVRFSYDNVESIPFWRLLKKFRTDLEDKKDHYCNMCFESARHSCSACKVAWYCSENCQKEDWKKGRNGRMKHKIMCKKFQKT
eukprot:CAMPEP_0113624608 /NCGR_PEP_ID=MMETSP0017_2-20120614/12693_1 /TAXON_ID=2856 /ORGANISM="Cylindrotheca closterium" /LENGTH=444 /DNA_ID=CAMNT_0000534659 /DNA_START=14 /DNA_END=1348 /DNA_ORIENTATION=- /assembly_acc=CAM_ASM_000147